MASPLEKLINSLKKFPGVGEKTATRYAFFILNADRSEIDDLLKSIEIVKRDLRLCSRCFHLTDEDLCNICRDNRRDASRLCVIESPLDLLAIEKSGQFKGIYHVLHGVMAPLDGIGPGEIRLNELLERVKQERIGEVILALNPTVEGEATASFIKDRLKDTKVIVSRIAYGIPVGGSLEYADPLTLGRALEHRTKI
ncbi:MAG: recombination mediator RecR [Deltaproteobacteria bacterium]|nr:recombination mediator RecR [Deltaproteobacteria bacterium]